LVWLALTALLMGAASRRPLALGLPAALVASALPEWVGRPEPGAVVEPSALLGAVVQLLVIFAVVALALLLRDWIASPPVPTALAVLPDRPVPAARPHRPAVHLPERARPRAPPRLDPMPIPSVEKGTRWRTTEVACTRPG
jgi:hypothetical protein